MIGGLSHDVDRPRFYTDTDSLSPLIGLVNTHLGPKYTSEMNNVHTTLGENTIIWHHLFSDTNKRAK